MYFCSLSGDFGIVVYLTSFRQHQGPTIDALTFVWNALRRALPPGATEGNEKVRGMQLTADEKGAVFDFKLSDDVSAECPIVCLCKILDPNHSASTACPDVILIWCFYRLLLPTFGQSATSAGTCPSARPCPPSRKSLSLQVLERVAKDLEKGVLARAVARAARAAARAAREARSVAVGEGGASKLETEGSSRRFNEEHSCSSSTSAAALVFQV